MVAAVALVMASGCGGSDDESAATPPPDTAGAVSYPGITKHLQQQTADLTAFTASFKEEAEAYYDLAESAGFDGKKLAATDREEAASILADLKRLWIQGNPAYEQMEGVVAGVPSLADYDVIIDAGGDASDPENAVPFSTSSARRPHRSSSRATSTTSSRRSLFGTEPRFARQGRQARPRRRRQRRVRRGAARRRLLRRGGARLRPHAGELDAAARSGSPDVQTRSPRSS